MAENDVSGFNTPINANAIQSTIKDEDEEFSFNTPINANAIQLDVQRL